jgi:hypothetical protein
MADKVMTGPTTEAGRTFLGAIEAMDALDPVARETPVDWLHGIHAIEQEAAAAERKSLREYLRHTRDQHGYPCPAAITPKEWADGVRCICGLDQPKRYMSAEWDEQYG